MKIYKYFTTAVLAGLMASCSYSTRYSIEKYHQTDQIDSLLVDIVTFVGRKPVTATWESRFNEEYRKHYISLSSEFTIESYFVSDDSLHYFYMIRPARHVMGSRRGVGGVFRISADNRIYDFEELFNTPVMPVEEIQSKGRELFQEMIKSGDVDRFLENREYVEWPDSRLKYDKKTNEWRYVSDF